MLRRIYDAGHSWLEVPREEIKRINITVTPWSYQRGDKVYLEEDVDMHTYLEARAAEIGCPIMNINRHLTIEEIDHGDESVVRSYQNYSQNYKEKDQHGLNIRTR